MRADPAVQRRLLELSEVDIQLARIAHRRRNLPELAEIDQLEASLRGKQDAAVAVRTSLGDIDRDISRLETEVEQVRARQQRDRALLDDGAVATKQLTELEHELQSLRRRQNSLEDDLLELMERREAEQADLEHREAELAEAREKLSHAQGRRDEVFADLDTAEVRRTEERKELISALPADLVALYDRLLRQKGTGAAEVRGRRCGACRLELDRTAMGQLRAAADDEVVRCEECGVILVRTKESGL